MKKLLGVGGAWPYLIAVFLNAFVDLGHKIIVQNTIFKTYDGSTQIILTAVVNGLILLPYILLLSPSGFVADKYPKNRVLQLSAWAALAITLGITACYYLGWFWPAFLLTFALAVQSAFYSPAKYGYIKPLFGKERIAQANGVVQSVTILAILAGTVVYSVFFETMLVGNESDTAAILQRIAPMGWLLVINAAIEVWMMQRLPTLEDGNPERSFDTGLYVRGKLLGESLRPARSSRAIMLSIFGLAMFWSVGQVLLASFPAYAKAEFAVENTILIQAILACAGIGIGLGSALAAHISQRHIETGIVPIGAIGIALAMWVLPQVESNLLQAACLLAVGICGGLFIVPLNALIQFYAGENELGRVLAANNWIQNLAMASFLVLTVVFAVAGFDAVFLLYLMAAVATAVGLYTVYQLPQSLVRIVLSDMIASHYRVDVQGMRHIPERGGVLLLGNHISWVDWAIVQIACPRPVRFVMIKNIYDKWYLNWLFRLVGCIPIQQGEAAEDALDAVAEALDRGEIVCLFPEGTISRTGQLAEFRQGFERACAKVAADIPIIPFYIRGLWGSALSRATPQLKQRRSSRGKRSLVVAFGRPMSKDSSADQVKAVVTELSIDSWQVHASQLPNLPAAWIETVKRLGWRTAAIDGKRRITAYAALLDAIRLSRQIRRYCHEARLSIGLPTGIDSLLANMATLLAGKTAVNMDMGAESHLWQLQMEECGSHCLLTTRALLAEADQPANVRVVYIEDLLQEDPGWRGRLRQWRLVLMPAALLKWQYCRHISADDIAFISYTRGKEWRRPRGVLLSHRNVLANIKQTADAINLDDDVAIASLPVSHIYGLCCGQLLPAIEGMLMVCCGDSGDGVGVAREVHRHEPTLMFSTPSQLEAIKNNAQVHPLMLNSLKRIIVGSEPWPEDRRQAFQATFAVPIFEGYGTTETTPVASLNVADALDSRNWKIQRGSKSGSVGLPLPGTGFRIVDPDSCERLPANEVGRIQIGGVQLMQGYVDGERDYISESDGKRWFLTDDWGVLDESGFLSLVEEH